MKQKFAILVASALIVSANFAMASEHASSQLVAKGDGYFQTVKQHQQMDEMRKASTEQKSASVAADKELTVAKGDGYFITQEQHKKMMEQAKDKAKRQAEREKKEKDAVAKDGAAKEADATIG